MNVALIAYAPLAEGILTGKYRSGATPIPGAYRILFYLEQLNLMKEQHETMPFLQRFLSKPRPLQFEKLEPLFIVLDEIAKSRGKTIGKVAINWLMRNDPSIIPIPGAKNVRQVNENIGALGWSLTEEEHSRINKAEMETR
ncbi:aldo/keto reductase [Bacillaceae bacterium Marseille-Q3522]|nr:aldo/keto reductase [Bacillaceae bacterium Marseille-Q3522]